MEDAAEQLRTDRDFVLMAVRQDGLNLEFAAEEFRADREVVIEAMKHSWGHASRCAAAELQPDPELVGMSEQRLAPA